MPRTYTVSEKEAAQLFALVSSHNAALKNWIVSAVERGDLEHAKGLTRELRSHQDLYAKLNVEAHKVIDAA
jgi:hypothetical protein